MENILKFHEKVCYADYISTQSSFEEHYVRITEIRLPFNFISIPYEVSSYCCYLKIPLANTIEFDFLIRMFRDYSYQRKKHKNLFDFLKNNLNNISIELLPHEYLESQVYKTFSYKEESLSEDECKKLLLDFYNSTPKYSPSRYHHMVNSIIDKIK